MNSSSFRQTQENLGQSTIIPGSCIVENMIAKNTLLEKRIFCFNTSLSENKNSILNLSSSLPKETLINIANEDTFADDISTDTASQRTKTYISKSATCACIRHTNYETNKYNNLNGNVLLDTIINMNKIDDNSNEAKTRNIKLKSYSEGVINDKSSYLNQTWNYLQVLDSNRKRLLNVLYVNTDELKKLIANLVKYKNVTGDVKREEVLENNEHTHVHSKPNATLDLQNNLTPLDKDLAAKQTDEGIQLPNYSITLQELKSALTIRNYVEVSKPYKTEDEGEGDTVPATLIYVATDKFRIFENLKELVYIPVNFIRENPMAVSVSIPCFVFFALVLSEVFTFGASINNGLKQMKYDIY